MILMLGADTSRMQTSVSSPDRRHVSNLILSSLVRYLEADVNRPGFMTRVLAQAGDRRRPADFLDVSSWSDYWQYRRLLEEIARELGGVDALAEAFLDRYRVNLESHTWTIVERDPGELYADMASTIGASVPIMHVETTAVGPHEWRIDHWFDEGFEPYPQWCASFVGTMRGLPLLYGYEPAQVEEVACRCNGAPRCEVRVRWERQENLELRLAFFEGLARATQTRFELLSATVRELLTGEPLEVVLPRVLEAVAQAIIAPVLVLAIDAPCLPRAVFGRGAPGEELAAIAEKVFAKEDLGPAVLRVEINSGSQHYGQLVAVKHDQAATPPWEQSSLQTFAGLIAAALDSGAALHEARRQAVTAELLLQLSTSLAGAFTVDEVCTRVTRAVPAVIDCDRATLYLRRDGAMHLVAMVGVSAATEAVLRSSLIPSRAATAFTVPTYHHLGMEGEDDIMAVMHATGAVASVSVPITAAGEGVGVLVAAVHHHPERLRSSTVIDERLLGLVGQAAGAIGNARLVEQVRHQALHDSLTGLPNRTLILDRTEQMLARARRKLISAGALFLDLDNFKDINDTLGHQAGDQILQAVAQRLTSVLRETDTVARLGGDEFVVLVEGASLLAGPEIAAARLRDALAGPFWVPSSKVPITVTASIGIAIGERASAGELLRDADIALYEAKRAGRDCAVVFHREMQLAVQDRHDLESDLRGALERHELFLLYQPTLNLASGAVTGVEALIRWCHPTRGVVGPDQFIPIAESSGLIMGIGTWVLHQACVQGAAWHRDGHAISMAVNVAARQLDDDQLFGEVQQALKESGLPAHQLTLEITETTLMRDAAAAALRLSKIKQLGVRLAIDDFGTGYSSLAYLRQFPVDSLKIDRSFISGAAGASDSGALVHTLVQLGKTLGIETLAEGIEDHAQLQQLQREECDTGQGFLFARPLTADEMSLFLMAHRSPDAAAVGSWAT